MALPLSGQISLSQIRAELGMSGTTNFSLIKASTSAPGYPILNPFTPNTPSLARIRSSPFKMSSWYGYSSATIAWSNISSGGGVANLKIYVNGVIVVNTSSSTLGSFAINNDDIFYATLTPITYSSIPPKIDTYRVNSPFNFINYVSISQTIGPYPPAAGTFQPFSSVSQTATILPIDLAAYAIFASY